MRNDTYDRTKVLDKAVLLLFSFTAEDHSVSFSELMERTGFPGPRSIGLSPISSR